MVTREKQLLEEVLRSCWSHEHQMKDRNRWCLDWSCWYYLIHNVCVLILITNITWLNYYILLSLFKKISFCIELVTTNRCFGTWYWLIQISHQNKGPLWINGSFSVADRHVSILLFICVCIYVNYQSNPYSQSILLKLYTIVLIIFYNTKNEIPLSHKCWSSFF